MGFLNFGKRKLHSSIDSDIRFITKIRTLHVGHAMTFVINQREGLNGLCMKRNDTLLNVSENLSMAFFWPTKISNLIQEADTINDGKDVHYTTYPTDIIDIKLGSPDLVATSFPLYQEYADYANKRAELEKTLRQNFIERYALTTVVRDESRSAWKFDHWRQFTQESGYQYEFCFQPVFKLDRVVENFECAPAPGLRNSVSEFTGYSDNPDRSANHNFGTIDCGPSSAVWDSWGGWHEMGGSRTYWYYSKTIRQEHFPEGWWATGEIPTVDYYQVATKREAYRESGYRYLASDGLVHGCSHSLSYNPYTGRVESDVWWGRLIYTTYSGKSVGSLAEETVGIDDPHAGTFFFFDPEITKWSYAPSAESPRALTVQRSRYVQDPYSLTGADLINDIDTKNSSKRYYVHLEYAPGMWISFADRSEGNIQELVLTFPVGMIRRDYRAYITLDEAEYAFTYFVPGEGVGEHDVTNANFATYVRKGLASDYNRSVQTYAHELTVSQAMAISYTKTETDANGNSVERGPYTDDAGSTKAAAWITAIDALSDKIIDEGKATLVGSVQSSFGVKPSGIIFNHQKYGALEEITVPKEYVTAIKFNKDVIPSKPWVRLTDVKSNGSDTVTYTVEWGGDLSGDAWVGLIPKTLAHGDEYLADQYDVQWVYVRTYAPVSGTTLKFVFPNITNYDLRVYANDFGGEELGYASIN